MGFGFLLEIRAGQVFLSAMTLNENFANRTKKLQQKRKTFLIVTLAKLLVTMILTEKLFALARLDTSLELFLIKRDCTNSNFKF